MGSGRSLVAGYFEFISISDAYIIYCVVRCVRGLNMYNVAYMQLTHAKKAIQITKSKMSALEAGIAQGCEERATLGENSEKSQP